MVRTETIRGFIKACGGMVFRVVSVSTQTLCQRDGVGYLAENMKKGGILSEWLIDDEAGRRWRAVLRKGGKLERCWETRKYNDTEALPGEIRF